MSDALPWYLKLDSTINHNPANRERYLRDLASQASPDADKYVTSLKAAEARGVQIDGSSRMAAGYAQNARRAEAILEAGIPQSNGPAISSDDLTPEQRISRGYGGNT
ncbi:hypothetical protein [Streptomyces sp. NPDC026589]|uniref:hypothetical protein n=1 Tax=Streptomyces sp. NPDC026589 TaxID=3155609 RepID=UPI0033E7722A